MAHLRRLNPLAGAAALALAITLSGCASAPTPAANAGLLQRMDAVMQGASTGRPVALRLRPDQVRTGDTLAVDISSATGGFVYLLQVGTDGKSLSLVFPNASDGANRLPPADTLSLPRPNWQMAARGITGVGYFYAVVAAQPQDLMALQSDLSAGKVQLAGDYGVAMAAMRQISP